MESNLNVLIKVFDDGQDVDIVLRPEDLDIVEVGKGKNRRVCNFNCF